MFVARIAVERRDCVHRFLFIGRPRLLRAEMEVAYDNAVYFNLCAAAVSVYNQAGMTRATINTQDFVPRPAFKASLCQ